MLRDVCFSARCDDTEFGDHVRVVGSCCSLGAWRPEGGLPLRTSDAEFPVWRAPPLKIHEDDIVEYKYVICDGSGRAERWEERPNRRMHLASLGMRGICTSHGYIFVEEDFNEANDSDEHRFRSSPSMALSEKVPPPVRTISNSCLAQHVDAQQEIGFLRVNTNETELVDMGVRITSATDLIVPTVRSRSKSATLPISDPDSESIRSGPLSWSGCSSDPVIPNTLASGTVSLEGLRSSTVSAATSSRAGIAPRALAPGPDEANSKTLVREESSSNLFASVGEGDRAAGDDSVSSEFTDRYVLIGNTPLGEGTFGLVWRCAARVGSPSAPGGRSEERAVKIIQKARLQPRDMKNLLGENGEVRTHITMKHKNIVTLFEYFDEASSVALVLECCRGGDLFDTILTHSRQTGQGLSEMASAIVTRDVLSALIYMHGHRVVHRDIKCENVLLEKVGIPIHKNVFKLCDFGFAASDYGQGFTERLGSPDNVAPEVVLGKPYSTPVDLWSLGVLLYMMISATPPFYAATDGEVLRKVRKGAYSLDSPFWDLVSPSVKAFIASLITVEPRLRPSAVQASENDFVKTLFEEQ